MLLIALVVGVLIYLLFFRNKKDESKKESGFKRGLKEKSTMPSNAPNCNSGCTLTENKDQLGNAQDCGNCSKSTDEFGTVKYYTCVCPNKSTHAPYRN